MIVEAVKLTQLNIFYDQLYYSSSAIEGNVCRPASMVAGKAVSKNIAWTVLCMLPLFGTFALLPNNQCTRDGASRATNIALYG